MIDKKKTKKELMNRYSVEILIEKINYFHEKDCGWKLSDLLEDVNNKEYYILNIYKGFVLTLLYFNYIEIYSNFGNQQYLFRTIKKIEQI